MDYGQLYDEHIVDSYDQDRFGLLGGARAVGLAQIAATDLPADATLLDLGVGTGETLAALAPRFPRARRIGVDLSARMIEVARRKVALEAHVDDACNAAAHVPAGSVDLAIAHFLTTFVDRPRLFAAARTVLRPGGFFSVVGSCTGAFRRAREAIGPLFADEATLRRANPTPDGPDALADEVRAAGFDLVAVERFGKPVVFDSAHEAVHFARTSGFFTHILEALELDDATVVSVLDIPGVFPFEDEYEAAIVLARAPGEPRA
jgi:SAM-dependent methyltransferase